MPDEKSRISANALIENRLRQDRLERRGGMMGAVTGMVIAFLTTALSAEYWLAELLDKETSKDENVSSWLPSVATALYIAIPTTIALFVGLKVGQKIGSKQPTDVDIKQITKEELKNINKDDIATLVADNLEQKGYRITEKEQQKLIDKITKQVMADISAKLKEESTEQSPLLLNP